ncbi:VWA domain-containing protein [Sulfitobacter sp. D35]|uniref:VWA domain-containing protein n=1 Tax=Sulfitobacter sp. D35 TaxID=3083252 RepID=UPI00296ED050|nr:VWA domain-containing protein [Sulfitobacter sp. D35]MDW4498646.1 VWA domain-containing protein [Sulfitobacter sp. D35]
MADFAQPLLLLLLPLPVLVRRFAPVASRIGTALVVPEGVGRHILAGAAGSAGRPSRRLIALWLAWTLLVVALAGPRVLAPQAALPMSGRDLMLVLDLSGSMVRDDFTLDGTSATRLEVVRRVGAEFARAREGDRVGLVVFGSEAYVASAPSFDAEAVARAIEEMEIGISGRATNISDGLGLALKRLEASDAESRVVILLSDGSNNAGAATPREAAALAGRMGVRVHTIALGPLSRDEAPEDRGVVDVETLRAMAKLSGGEMFRVRTTEDLRAAARTLDALEPTARAGLAAQTHRALWPWPGAAALLLCLWIGTRER